MAKEEKNKPVFKARAGHVVATVWENEQTVEDRKFMALSARLVKTYKKGEEWHETSSFTVHDLQDAQAVIDAVLQQLRVKSGVNE